MTPVRCNTMKVITRAAMTMVTTIVIVRLPPGGGHGVPGQEKETERGGDEPGGILGLHRARDRPGRGAGGELARGRDVPDEDGLDEQVPDAQAGDGPDLIAHGGADPDADRRE